MLTVFLAYWVKVEHLIINILLHYFDFISIINLILILIICISILISLFKTILNMTTRTFKITEVAHIMCLLDSSALERIIIFSF